MKERIAAIVCIVAITGIVALAFWLGVQFNEREKACIADGKAMVKTSRGWECVKL